MGIQGVRVQKPEASRTSDTIRERFATLERLFPKRSRRAGHYAVLRSASSPARSTGATLYLYMHSSDDTYAIHETVFRNKDARTVAEWDKFFYKYVFHGWDPTGNPKHRDGLLRGVIIPAMNIKSNKLWDVISCIGYSMYDLSGAAASGPRKKRHKAKPPRKPR